MFSNSIIDYIKKIVKQIFFIYKVTFYIFFYIVNKFSWYKKETNYFDTLLLTGLFLTLNTIVIYPSFYIKYPLRGVPVMLLFALINYFLLYYKDKYIDIIDYFETNKPKDIHYLFFFCYIILTFLLFPFMDYIRSVIK